MLEFPWFDNRVHVIITHRADSIFQANRIERSTLNRISRARNIQCSCCVTDVLAGERVVIAFLSILMGSRVDTADDIDSLRDKEGIISHLILLAVGVMIGIICTGFDEDLEYAVSVLVRILFTGLDDIVERIAQTVERIINTRTHLAVHIGYRVCICIILQCARGLGVDEVGMHHIETVHHVFLVHGNLVVLIDSACADIDKVVILHNQCIVYRIERPCEVTCGLHGGLRAVHTGNIEAIERGEFNACAIPSRIGYTGA